jgi:hypothetical protein
MPRLRLDPRLIQTNRLISGSPACDKSVEIIYGGLDKLIKSACRLKEETEGLDCLRSLQIIHCQQYDHDLDQLRSLYKR